MILLSTLSPGAIAGIVIGAVALIAIIIIIWWIATHNKFVRLSSQVEEGFATIDVYLKKRFDLIPNLVETVKGYAAHEKETFTEVTEARAAALKANTPNEKIAADARLTRAVMRFSRIEERYPDLKANGNFMDLQKQLQSVETELSQSRKYYNATVRVFNGAILSFPSSIVAKSMKLEKQAYFEAVGEERENVKVKF